MPDLFQVATPGTGRETLLVVLSLVVAALFVVTLVFSAYAIALRLHHKRRDRLRAQFAARWRDQMLLAVTDENEASALRESIREDEGLHFVGFAVQYARRVRGEGRDGLRGMVRPYLRPVAMRADSPSVGIRARAIQTLGTLGLPEHSARVIAALDDPSPLVAMVAARALAQEESPEYAAAVLQRLGRFEGWNRRFLASMLAAMGAQISPTLRAALADPRGTPPTRVVLAEALQIQGDPLAGDAAVEVLGSTTDQDLVAAALRLLHAIGRPEHAEVVRSLNTSPDDIVRAQALKALGSVGTETDLPRLLTAMTEESPWAALNAARGVLEAGGAAVLSEIAASDRPTAVLARQVLSESGAA